MNVKQSWSRHGEEVKDKAFSAFEIAFLVFGVISPVLIMVATVNAF
jgi:hypothetical protein|tara:strand:- start:2773 stop:2910 length:138 start_codon:yes stop_codon:yes gene_type:complete